MTIQELIDILEEYVETEGNHGVVVVDNNGRQYDVDAVGMGDDGIAFEIYI